MPEAESDDFFSQAQAFLRRRDFARAEALCAKILKIRPEDGRALGLAGLAALLRGDPERAAERLARAAARETASYDVLNNLGTAYMQLLRFAAAQDAYGRALALRPDDATAQFNFRNAAQGVEQADGGFFASKSAYADALARNNWSPVRMWRKLTGAYHRLGLAATITRGARFLGRTVASGVRKGPATAPSVKAINDDAAHPATVPSAVPDRDPYWWLWADEGDRLSDQNCDEIIAQALALPVEAGVIGIEGVADETIRRSAVRWLLPEEFPELFALIKTRVERANQEAFGFSLSAMPRVQFGEYHAARKGYYNWHPDAYGPGQKARLPTERKLSIVIQLSDPNDYEGGDLELDLMRGPDRHVLRRKGAMIVFPSFVLHRVTPLRRGLRYSLASWYEGPHFN